MSENIKKIFVMSPYHDINSPFSVGEAGNFAEYIARDPDQCPELILGAFALIRDKDTENNPVWLVARIIELKAVSPFSPQRETALYAEDERFDPSAPLSEIAGPHHHQPMIARVRLERSITKSGETGFISHPVQRPPSGRSCLHFPDITGEGGDAPSLRQMLEIPKEGITLGYVGQGNAPFQSGKEFLPYKWNVDELDNKHIFVIGESGSGKTVLLKNLAYELRKHKYKNASKPRIIMTDVQGDIAQLLTHKLPGVALTAKGWQSEIPERETADDAMDKLGPFRLVVPVTKGGPSNRLAALKTLAKKQGHEVREIGLRLEDLDQPSDVEYLYRVSSEQVAILLDKIAEYCKNPAKKGVSPRPASLEELRKNVNQSLGAAQGSAKIPVGDTSFYATTFEAATRALLSLERYFDIHQPSMAGGRNPLNAMDFDGTAILYMDDLDADERIMWEMQLVKWLYEKRRDKWNAFAFFDEAHQIIPAKPLAYGKQTAGTFDRLRLNFERLAREGRKFGINLVLGTQSPQDLHPIVPEQCATKMVMKINPRNAAYVSLEKELSGIAARFGAGQFFIQSPFNGTPDWVRVHSGAPPLPHMSMTAYWNKAEKAAENKN